MAPRRSVGLALVCAVSAVCLWLLLRQPRSRAPEAGPATSIVSLTPAVTETLFAIGAGSRVAGVSDYCDYPSQVAGLPRLGTALTPNFERIAGLRPDLIVSDLSVASDKTRLDSLGPTLRLPWLSLSEIANSTRQLGRFTGDDARANALAARLEQRLSVPPPPAGPRVLLVLAGESAGIDPVWFIRKNSMHGAALHAAGGRNAVPEEVHAMPRISLERVIALDPDLIVLLTGKNAGDGVLDSWRKLHVLSAVKNAGIGVLPGKQAFAHGPRILDFADALERELRRLSARPSAPGR
jgi:iron complex transport system substrate-binding protein